MHEAQHAFERVLHAEHVGGTRVGVLVLGVSVTVIIVRVWRTVMLLMVVAMLIVRVRSTVTMPMVVAVLIVRVRLVPALFVGVLVLMSVVVAVLCHSVMP